MFFSFLWFVKVTLFAFKFFNQNRSLLFLNGTLLITLGTFICLPIHGKNYTVTGFDHTHVREIFHFLFFGDAFRFIKFDCIYDLLARFISFIRALSFTLISMKCFDYFFKVPFCFLFFIWFADVFEFNVDMLFIAFFSIKVSGKLLIIGISSAIKIMELGRFFS